MVSFYTAKEVAAILRVDLRTIPEYIKAGCFRGIKLRPGRSSPWRIDKDSFDAYARGETQAQILAADNTVATLEAQQELPLDAPGEPDPKA